MPAFGFQFAGIIFPALMVHPLPQAAMCPDVAGDIEMPVEAVKFHQCGKVFVPGAVPAFRRKIVEK